MADDACDPDRLTALVLGRDRGALDAITRCYADRLLRAGRRHCRNTEEAKDAVQETLLTATTRLAEFRGEGSLEGWLVRIVARACSRMRRGQKNDPARHGPASDLPGGSESPEDGAALQELRISLNEALASLSPEDRLIVLLAEAEGYAAAEIASRIGLSEGAVRTRLSRARARLRELLRENDEIDPGGA